MKEYFKENYNKLKYSIDTSKGLRNAQIGGAHAISSFFTLEKKEAAIVVMPTGSGKTAVLMMAPYMLCKRRLLVVTPSKMVRGQITEDFSELRTLCAANVFEDTIKKPNVFELEHLFKEEFIPQLENADVIVATPNCALSLSESEWAKEKIDLIEVDEAHHTPAKTWQQILININNASHILFTATPFRLDRKEISGEVIYNYPLSQAYKDGIFGEVQYVPVDDAKNKDICIAKKVEEILLNDRGAGFEHYLMVRTDTKDNATLLEEIYKNNTSLRLAKIDSSMMHSKIKKSLLNLREGNLDGVICVDMLGEGYDFPNLKIAAIHVPHKSLASTLQFIGRFARTNAKNIGTAKFIALNDEELQIENNLLYSKDSIWQEMIIGMSEGKNAEETENRNYYKEFSGENFSFLENVPIHAIRPNCHAKIYRSSSFNINSEFPDICNVSRRIIRNHSENIVVGIGLDYISPLWMGNGDKINIEYILYIIHFQKETNMVYIYSQKHSEAMYSELISSFCDKYNQIPRHEIYRVLGGLKNFEIFNSGMLSKQTESGESYRISAGSDVSDAIDKESGRLYSAGHAFCKATDDSEAVTIGYSSAAKVWSSSYKNLRNYVDWCDSLGKKIANKNIEVKTNTNFDYLPHPTVLERYPNNIFYADYEYKTYSNAPILRTNNGDKTFRLTDAVIKIYECTQDLLKIEISLEDYSEFLECDLNGRYRSLGKLFIVRDGSEYLDLEVYLTNHPLIYRTLDDTTIDGVNVLQGDYKGDIFDNSIIEGIDWSAYGTDISLEFRKDIRDNRVSIQDALCETLKANKDYKYIIYDHGSGEIADFITIKESDTELIVEFFHVKRKSGAQVNSSLKDIYEVSGQAIKSAMWFSTKGKLIDKIASRSQAGHCKIVHGNDNNTLIKELRGVEKILRGFIYIVQPGISKSAKMPDKFQEVLAATSTYIKKAGKVKELRILGSI